jgi:hypothetical protein
MDATDESASGAKPVRPRWSPIRCELSAVDVPIERLRADAIDVPQRLIGHVTIEQHLAGTMLAGRLLRDDHGADVTVQRDQAGVFFLELSVGERTLTGFAVVAQSSMEPRPIWPMMLPIAVVQHRPIDWIIACSVPKMFVMEALEDGPADAYVLGGLPSEELDGVAIVDVLPHMGHEFEAKYRQTKNHRLWPLERFMASLAARSTDQPPVP